MWPKNKIGRLRMAIVPPQGFTVGRCLVRISASEVGLPGVKGWVGAWTVYATPYEDGDVPVRFGDTPFQDSAETALAMARKMASIIAMSL